MKLERSKILPPLIVGSGLLLALVLLVTGPDVEPRVPVPPIPLVRVLEVQPGALQLRVETHGTVMPRTESDLIPEVSGPVVWVSGSLVSGGFFQADEVLLRIDPSDYETALEQARARVSRAQSEHRLAQRELERQRDLAAQNVASPAQLDIAVNLAAVAEAALRESRAARLRAERDLERTEIRAPYDGRVRSESIDVGQFASRGGAVAVLYAVDFAEVRLPVPDEELAYLDLPLVYRDDVPGPGPEVILRARFAGKEHEWRGQVVRTEGELDPKSRMVHVVARVSDPYGRDSGRPPLSIGLFVEAEILGARLERAVVLPRSALRSGNQVLVVDSDSRLRYRPVEVVRRAGDEAVIGAGLEAGDRVCLSPLEAAVDGMAVRINEAETGS